MYGFHTFTKVFCNFTLNNKLIFHTFILIHYIMNSAKLANKFVYSLNLPIKNVRNFFIQCTWVNIMVVTFRESKDF